MSEKCYVLCVDNTGYFVSLDVGKIYETLPDLEGEQVAMIRVVDNSGEDYLFEDALFVPVAFDESAGVFSGCVKDPRGLIHFEGEDAAELYRAFLDSVADFEEFCSTEDDDDRT